jgi:hypothetical protein
MALKPCRECGQDISSKARACPGCGARQSTSFLGLVGYALAITCGLFIVLLFVGSQMGQR